MMFLIAAVTHLKTLCHIHIQTPELLVLFSTLSPSLLKKKLLQAEKMKYTNHCQQVLSFSVLTELFLLNFRVFSDILKMLYHTGCTAYCSVLRDPFF